MIIEFPPCDGKLKLHQPNINYNKSPNVLILCPNPQQEYYTLIIKKTKKP